MLLKFIIYCIIRFKPQWYPLITTRKNDDVSGQVKIKVGLVEKDNKFQDARDWNSFWQKLNNLTINDEKIDSGAPLVRPTHERNNSLSALSDIVGVVFLEIVCAIDLPREKDGKSFNSAESSILYAQYF